MKEGVQFPQRIAKKRRGFAHGGEVEHYCSEMSAHHPDCEYYADGGEVETNKQFINNPDLSVDTAVASHGLHHLLTKTGNSKSPDDTMSSQEFIDHSKRGQKIVENHSKNIFSKDDIDHSPGDTESLKNHIREIQDHPGKMLNIAGNIGDQMPLHAAVIGAKAATAYNYLQSIKPMASQTSPLGPVLPPSKMESAHYERQLKIAQNPLSVVSKIKDGTLQPHDLNTMSTLYPKLMQKIKDKATEELAEAKQKGEKISYKKRQGLSLLFGQSIDGTMTPQIMQTIMKANAPSQAPQQQGGAKKASGVELDQINKTNDMLETPLQKRQINKK